MGMLKRQKKEDAAFAAEKEKQRIITSGQPDDEVMLFNRPRVMDDFFRKLPDDPVQQAGKLLEKYQKSPDAFLKYELGVPTDLWPDDLPPRQKWTKAQLPIWSKQREILNALRTHRKVAVKSGHGVGKTRTAGLATMWLHYAYHALGITTAPTFRQVRRVLWGEIHDLYHNAPRKLGGKLHQTSLESGEKWFVEGFSTKDPKSAVTGFHEENIFVVVDEAGGVVQDVFDAMQGVLTSAGSFVLLIGNPIDAASAFADAFQPDSEYKKITISCYDSPNVRHGWNIYPKLTSFDWPEKMKAKWGVDSNLFRVRVLGEFPEEGMDTLIPIKYINQALDNYAAFEEGLRKDFVLISIGVDVARMGSDSTVIGARWRNKHTGMEFFDVLGEYEKTRVNETTDYVVEWYEKLVKKAEYETVINIDDIGLGGGVVDNLMAKGYPVNGVNVGETPDTFVDWDSDEKFLNKRAQYYWYLRERMSEETFAIKDEGLAFELSKIGLDFGRGGSVIKIEEKAKTRKKLSGRSPDKADCCMLAMALDELEGSGDLIYVIGRN